MRWMTFLAGAAGLAFVGSAVAMRLVPMPPDVWHVEPADVTPPMTPNFVLLVGDNALESAQDLSEIAQEIDAAAKADGAERIAGDLANGHATYIARSTVMGFPDAVSLRLHASDGVTRIEVFSRSRFGVSDLGANRARLVRWLPDLADQVP